MPQLIAVPADDVTMITARSSTTTICTTTTTTPLRKHIALGAIPLHVPRDVAQIAHRIIGALTGQVTSLPAVVASLLIGAVGRNVPLLVAVVAEPQITRGQLRGRAVPSEVTLLATGVADAFILTLAGQVARLLAVPADNLGTALSCDVPWKATVVA